MSEVRGRKEGTAQMTRSQEEGLRWAGGGRHCNLGKGQAETWGGIGGGAQERGAGGHSVKKRKAGKKGGDPESQQLERRRTHEKNTGQDKLNKRIKTYT